MPEWLWGAAFIAVLLAIGWVADWRTKRHYWSPASNRLVTVRASHAGGVGVRSDHAGDAAVKPRASS